jgi:hypothetical protein
MARGRKSAAQLRDEMDTEVRDFLTNTYGPQEWSRAEAIDGFLTMKGITPNTWDREQLTQLVAVAIGRVRREVVNGFQRYWWTGRDCYQEPAAIPQEVLFARASGYMATATGLVSLAGEHELLRKSKGVSVDTSTIDDLIQGLSSLKAQL